MRAIIERIAFAVLCSRKAREPRWIVDGCVDACLLIPELSV